MKKYIFITGGVISGLGKGITAASLGRLLKSRGYRVFAQKLDPYINVDPGTMSPYQHGEVYVTEDGAETDLDLGHYERFMDVDLNRFSNLTTGKVYWNVLTKERKGEYLGNTVQVIPHITDEIKSFIYGAASEAEIVITEIGGTVGDIESQPFLEAVRQVFAEKGRENCILVHVALVPYLKSSGEYKSKPAQHSAKELMKMGLMPQVIVTRSDKHIDSSALEKISLFCNVKRDCVIENINLPSIYEVPVMLEKAGLCRVVCRELGIEDRPCDMSGWESMLQRRENSKNTVRIALVGKYVKLHDAYLSVSEALYHGGSENEAAVEIDWIEAEDISRENAGEILGKADGIIVPGGFGERGIEGMINAAEYARENKVPYLGICLGMQTTVIEFARHVAGLADASSGELDRNCRHKVIDIMEEQKGIDDKGGTMRLGAYPCLIKPGTMMETAYGQREIRERHRHRYEFNNVYKKTLEEKGMIIAGTSPDGKLVEAIELDTGNFFVAVQYHPEFRSRPDRAHPLFREFIAGACKRRV